MSNEQGGMRNGGAMTGGAECLTPKSHSVPEWSGTLQVAVVEKSETGRVAALDKV